MTPEQERKLWALCGALVCLGGLLGLLGRRLAP